MDETLETAIGERREVLAIVRRILIENLKVDRTPDEIDPDVPLFGTGLGLDSVDAVELLVALETTAGIQLPEETHAPAYLRTVGSLVALILGHRRGSLPAIGLEERAFSSRDDAEMRALRTCTAYSRSDDVLALRITGEPFEALDPLVPSDLFLRDGQMRQSLILDDRGHPIADTYVAHDDGALWMLVEGMEPAALDAWCRELRADVERRWIEHEVISIHGPWAWELTARLLGEDLVALPYLGLFHFAEGACFRGGKTGEFGYDLLIPRANADAFVDRLCDVGHAFDLARIGPDHLAQAKRETFFFDVDAWRTEDVTPVELQLGWRVSTRKKYVGSDAVNERRARGDRTRAMCLVGDDELRPGDVVTHGERTIGRVVHSGYSAARSAWIAHALLALDAAEADVDVYLAGEKPVRTVAPPVLSNRSLHVDPRRHTFVERARERFPAIAP